MSKCKRCGSQAINPHLHGRGNDNLDLCDVCYWRDRAEYYAKVIDKIYNGTDNKVDY